jgi:hypothetical protein
MIPDGVDEDVAADPAGEMSATGLADMVVQGEWSGKGGWNKSPKRGRKRTRQV